jgi:predicted Zn finger-like uncharacterized protein
MSLATRCTSCGTIFRVVQDQLRVSEGWVRCGRCAEVFDAREQLFDVEREAPPPWSGSAAHEAPARPLEQTIPSPPHEEHFADRVVEDDTAEHISLPTADFGLPHPREAEPDPVPAPDARSEPRWIEEHEEPPAEHAPIFADPPQAPLDAASIEPPPVDMGDRPDVVLAPSLQPRKKKSKAAPKPTAPAPAPVPSFMRRAEMQARWRRPGVRLALGACSLLLVVLLGAQAALHFRDALSAVYPSAKPLLASLCEMQGCEIKPWRRIDVLSVENTALSQAGGGNQYQLTVALRNKSGVAVALPWVDLSLTDTAGAVVARRTLSPADFRTDKGSALGDAIAAGADVPMQVLLSTGPLRVSGYSVEIFHP